MLHPMFDEIPACSDAELLRLLGVTQEHNYRGRLDYRIDEIVDEIKKRSEDLARRLESGEIKNVIVRAD